MEEYSEVQLAILQLIEEVKELRERIKKLEKEKV